MKNMIQLKQWLFNKPAMFSLIFFGLSMILCIIYSLFQTFMHFETQWPMVMIFSLSFVFSAYYMIKKLPHDKISQHDFVAIANGASIISITSSIIVLLGAKFFLGTIQRQMMMLYLLHPTIFVIIASAFALITLYILGVAISGVYAKYKRATTIGISPWKVILSMPFTFLMTWVPGYLNENKNQKSNMVIKSKWYNRFNNWVLKNFSNLLFAFLFLLFVKSIIAGLSTTVLTFALLIIYTLWYKKHKSDFMKNINKGYALTTVCINLSLLIAIILTGVIK